MDLDEVLKHLQSKHEFLESDFEKLSSYFEHRSFKKNELLFKAGDIVRHTFFVTKGVFRQYYVNEEGKERTIYFTEEGNFAGELMSFLFKTPTKFYYQALEDAELLLLNREDWEHIFTTVPSFSLYQLKLHAQFIADLKEVMGSATRITPDEKYRRLQKNNPGLLQRLTKPYCRLPGHYTGNTKPHKEKKHGLNGFLIRIKILMVCFSFFCLNKKHGAEKDIVQRRR